MSTEMRMDITSFSGFRATNFANLITFLLHIVSDYARIKNILKVISKIEYNIEYREASENGFPGCDGSCSSGLAWVVGL